MGDGNTPSDGLKSGGESEKKKKNVPDDFMVPLQIFLYVLLSKKKHGVANTLQSLRFDVCARSTRIFQLAHSNQARFSVVVKMKILFASSQIHPPSLLCFCASAFFIICFTTV
jgi:hypothetical protein